MVPAPLRPAGSVEVERLRVAVLLDNGLRTPEPEIAEAVGDAATRLSEAGCRVEEALPPGIGETQELFHRVLVADGGSFLRGLLEAAGTDPEKSSVKGLLAVPPSDGAALASIVGPVTAIPACRHGEADHDMAAFSYTMTWNLTGWPGAVVRAGTAPGGLPIGVQLVAGPWREDVALALAAELERSFGPFAPPVL